MFKQLLGMVRLSFLWPSHPETVRSQDPIENPEDYDPQWVWDIYGTGIKPPKRPLWLDGWEKEVFYSDHKEVELIAPLYDEIEKYLDDLDKHRGRKVPEPRIIAFWGIFGEIKILRKDSNG